MAEIKKTATPTEKMVKIKLKKLPGSRAPKEAFYSVNFKNYIIKYGEEVEVPESIAKMIEDNEAAMEYAESFSEEVKAREKKEIG